MVAYLCVPEIPDGTARSRDPLLPGVGLAIARRPAVRRAIR